MSDTPPSASGEQPAGRPASRSPLLAGKPDEAPAAKPAAVARNLVTGEPTARHERRPSPGSSSGPGWAGLLTVVNTLALGGAVAYFLLHAPAATTSTEVSTPVAETQTSTASAPATSGDTESLRPELDRARSQIAALQRQLDAQREERERTQARLQEMADRMALVIKQTSFVPTAEASRASSTDAPQVAAMLPSVSPSTSELLLLKERNRLSEYADRAIATGSRDALQALVDAMADPAMKPLGHAALAEYKRVQAHFEISLSIDPGYTLPLQELFKEKAPASEADLKPAQLLEVLKNTGLPWEARLRSAYLLRGSTKAGTDEALLAALETDPSLDVAKQAQTTFEKRVGRRFRLFDIPSIQAWWKAQKGK